MRPDDFRVAVVSAIDRCDRRGQRPSSACPCDANWPLIRRFPKLNRHPLFDRGHCLARHAGEGLDVLSEGERLGRECAVLHGVSVAPRSAAAGTVHAADAMSPNRRRSALQPAPLRFGVASRRPVHVQEHGVVLRFFRAPRPPRLER